MSLVTGRPEMLAAAGAGSHTAAAAPGVAAARYGYLR